MLSVTIITRDEARNLPDALASVSWADEIVVVDSESTDETADIARASGARVIVRPWPGYAEQKNFADSQASGDWILNLDADERVTPELRELIQEIVSTPQKHAAFYVRRRNCYLGRWLKHSGWYPDHQLRLYRRGAGEWRGEYVHESFRPSGTAGYLAADLLHHSIRTLAEHHERLGRYTTLAAKKLGTEGKSASFRHVALLPILTFLRSYVVKLGFLDGFEGLCVSFFAAYYVFLKYAKLRENERRNGRAA